MQRPRRAGHHFQPWNAGRDPHFRSSSGSATTCKRRSAQRAAQLCPPFWGAAPPFLRFSAGEPAETARRPTGTDPRCKILFGEGGTIQSLAGYRLGRSAPPPYTRAWCDPDSALREIRSLSHCCHAPPPQVFPACTCLTPDTRIDTYPQREEPAAFVTFFRLQNTQNTGLAAKHPMDC